MTVPELNPHSSASRWRHQESSAFARFAVEAQVRTAADVQTTATTTDKSATEPSAEGEAVAIQGLDGNEVVCGPLLNYRHMKAGRWHGSVLIVVKGGGSSPQSKPAPSLVLRPTPAGASVPGEVTPDANGDASGADETRFEAHCLYSNPGATFWAFDIDVPVEAAETSYEYILPDNRLAGDKPLVNRFFVPAAAESMRIMFHSCNGFSVGTDEDAWSGPALWNDVMRKHAEVPFHVMIGGGDQIYNDGIRVDGPLRAWTDIGNPKKRADYPFPETLRAECDEYYYNNYVRWYSTAPFSAANGQIPQLNIWDDHDIIDGFGSYVDNFMRCDVFRGIGGTAHKYYMLFQHHLPPPPSTYTTDFPAQQGDVQRIDPAQIQDSFVSEPRMYDQYIVGNKPGPYVAERSYNMYSRLGARIAMIGLDARTERTRHQVNYPETYDLVFERLRSELKAAADAGEPIKHLILLLGIPIAYPRLTWLENIFRSPVMGPVKFMNRRFGLGGGLFNKFDGSIDLLDDLDDHYTARTHKKERAKLMLRLQEIAATFSVRVTILGGDVHLAALGRFYSKPDLKVPAEEDHRYMVNVISSAIVNKPPPQPVANLLARRNKIHHLNHKTDETLLNLFNKDPGSVPKSAKSNHCTMPSRNFASLTENSPNNPGANTNGGAVGEDAAAAQSFLGNDGHGILHKGETSAGTEHKAASRAQHGKGHDGTLDVCINVEIDQHDPQGFTAMYGLTVPLLDYRKHAEPDTPPSTAAPSQHQD